MKKTEIQKRTTSFEETKKTTDDGIEFWHARDLQPLLGYDRWENFSKVIKKAKTACKNSKQQVSDHFLDATKKVTLGSGAKRNIKDFILSRYACYLIAQNGDPRKEEVAFAMTYFALATRQYELIQKALKDIERIEARERLKEAEKILSRIIYKRAGSVPEVFQNVRSSGDKELFGGLNTYRMKEKYGISQKEPLADYLATVVLDAKKLAVSITNYKVESEDIIGAFPVQEAHENSNKVVRQSLLKSGIKPEDLPPEEDIKKVKRRLKSEQKKLSKKHPKLNEKD